VSDSKAHALTLTTRQLITIGRALRQYGDIQKRIGASDPTLADHCAAEVVEAAALDKELYALLVTATT
jgi:hypothetical protein